nr:hypothetical protein GCM10020093_066310 [Planobispora longispora]
MLKRDGSREVVGMVVPALRRIAEAVRGGPDEPAALGVLARALMDVAPEAAEAQFRELAERADARADHWTASAAMGELMGLYLGTGRSAEALELAERKIELSRRAGLGPWTLLAGEALRAQVLLVMGQDERALAEVSRLLERAASLPSHAGADEGVTRWKVQELLLDVGRSATVQLKEWERALEFNAERLALVRGRGATETAVATARFADYAALLRLERVEEAWRLLVDCREVFERHQDMMMLGKVLAALADAEDKRGHGRRAIGLERDALRYKYATRDVAGLAVSHHNLGTYLTWHAGQAEEGWRTTWRRRCCAR